MKRCLRIGSAVLWLVLLSCVLVGCLSKNVHMTVSFDANGGTAIEPQQVSYGELADAPVPPTRSGFIFDGWQTADGETWIFDRQPVKKNVTLIAQWREASISLSIRTVSDPFEDLFKPLEERILKNLNYEFVTTQFSSFVDTADPQADAVYRKLDDLQITEDDGAFQEQLKTVLGRYSTSPSHKYKTVSSVFFHNYKDKHKEVMDGLNSDDPKTKAAAQELEQRMLEQVRILVPSVTDQLPPPTVIAVAFMNLWSGFGWVEANFSPTLQGNVPLQISVSDDPADYVLQKDGALISFEYEKPLLPAAPKRSETTTGEDAPFPGETPVTDEESAADPKNWFTLADRNATASPSANGFVSLTSFSGYVIRKTVTLSVPGQTDAYFLAVTTSVTRKDGLPATPTRVVMTTEGVECPMSDISGGMIYSLHFHPFIRIPAGETLTVHLYVFVDVTEYPIENLNALEHITVDVWFSAVEHE